MKRKLITLIIIIASVMGFGGPILASSFDCNVFSDPDELENKLTKTISKLDDGETLMITGTCNVNLLISADVHDITLDGQRSAVLNGYPDRDVVRVEGKNIVIKGFYITGGKDGIHVHWGGHMSQQNEVAGLEDNVIHNNNGRGVMIHGNSAVKMINNVIHDNPGPGIIVSESSAARIGTYGLGDNSNGPNTIERNGGGILVERGSTANIVGNYLQSNFGPGVNVNSGSQAHVIDNDISSNFGVGVGTGGSSSVRISGNMIDRNKGDGIRVRKNAKATLQGNASVEGNDGFALVCDIAGVVDGNLAGLRGKSGSVEMDATCVEVLGDYPPSP